MHVLCGIALAVLLLLGIVKCQQEAAFDKIPAVAVHCKLLDRSFSPDTHEWHAAPVFNGKTVSTAVYSTGHSEKKITVWDCGSYGCLVSEHPDIYRYGRSESVLLIRSSPYATRIIGIQRD